MRRNGGDCRLWRRCLNGCAQGLGSRRHLGCRDPPQLLVDHVVRLDRHAEKSAAHPRDPRPRRVAILAGRESGRRANA